MSNWTQLISAVRDSPSPAPALRPALLAQCILESNRGQSRLAIDHGNYAGLKWREEMAPHASKVSYGAHDGVADYCAFASEISFVSGYWAFIGRSVYNGWQAYSDDPEGYIAFLKARHYAGDPNYVTKVTALLPEARSLLGAGAGADIAEPDRPSRSRLGETVSDWLDADADPEFVTLAGVNHKWQDHRPNGLEGAIVHFDAGRVKPKGKPDDPEWGARNTLSGAVPNGFAYCTVSRTGKIYLPANMDWGQWGKHAGKSLCPATSRTDVSRFYVGFEVNSPGYLYPTADSDVFVPWFNAVRDTDGNIIYDAKGRATIVSPNDVLYRKAELRHIKTPNGNIRPGAYVPYTTEQMIALKKVMLWLKRHFPRNFRLERVYGHDEVSPMRKVDPGGSLGLDGQAMTMAQFRASLLESWAKIIAP